MHRRRVVDRAGASRGFPAASAVLEARPRWRLTDLPGRVVATSRSGWYFRVLADGQIEAGMPVELLDRSNPDWPVARANAVLYAEKSNAAIAAELAAVPGLSESWRAALLHRVGALLGR